MAQIRPFRAYRYDTTRLSPGDVLTQPYDKISPEMQQRYYDLSPDNLITIEKGKNLADDTDRNNVHTRAADKLHELIAKHALGQDAQPSIYVYEQNYRTPGHHERKTRRGFIALGHLEDYETGVVFRHEKTLSAPKADRLELLRHTKAQTGLLFMLYDDATQKLDAALEKIAATSPTVEFDDEFGVTHHLWQIIDDATIQNFVQAMADNALIIADGHHRYETALNYRDERRKQAAAQGGAADPDAPYEFAVMAFFNTRASGLTILPTHRVVRNVPNFNWAEFHRQASELFDWQEYATPNATNAQTLGKLVGDMARSAGSHSIGVYSSEGLYRLTLRRAVDLAKRFPDLAPGQRELDVVLLHGLLLEECLGITAAAVVAEQNVTYVREIEKAVGDVDAGRAQLAFLLNPVSVQTVVDLASRGEVLPQKSTDFYPKVLSGLVIYVQP
jgi:uncharacterized protein (DUF1015 family)